MGLPQTMSREGESMYIGRKCNKSLIESTSIHAFIYRYGRLEWSSCIHRHIIVQSSLWRKK